MPGSDSARTLAITRAVSRAIEHCELSHIDREPIDLERARAQHREYEDCLRRMGCEVIRLPEAPELPDSVFVEDVAVVLDEVAIVTRLGAPSRQPEAHDVAAALAPYRSIVGLETPATLDGGDVIVAGKTIFVGRSDRTNDAGRAQLAVSTEPFGYQVVPVEFSGCLHLKSAATCVGGATLLVQTQWVSPASFGDDLAVIEVDPLEPFGGNALWINDSVLCGEAFPRTRRNLEQRGLAVLSVDASELAKAEGGLTCCSLVFDT